MNSSQKLAIVILRCFAVFLSFLGLLFMGLRGSFPYPVSNPSYFEAGMFTVVIIFLHTLPGILLYFLSKILGKIIGSNL
jgi:hypothetical protein